MLNEYIKLFENNIEYNNHLNDLYRYDFVINEIKKNGYKSIIDISSGRGFLLDRIKNNFNDVKITSTDIKKFNNIDVEFVELDLLNIPTSIRLEKYDLLSCLDVLEHFHESDIDSILRFISKLSNNFCLSIANHSDNINGCELHLTQRNKDWWLSKIYGYFNVIDSFNMFNDRLYCFVLKKK
jgi:2-polyprenyl-3-methyl-5-hydroxy-6-metoxy-1,4-benzoquinol methylase